MDGIAECIWTLSLIAGVSALLEYIPGRKMTENGIRFLAGLAVLGAILQCAARLPGL